MIDTHAHLDACDESPRELVARARAAGVTRIVTIGTGIESCRRALEISAAEPGVYAAVGIDPHQAVGDEAQRLGELAELARAPGVVAIGETGLDAHYGSDTLSQQRLLFEAHLDLAGATGLPIVIHCREAAHETVDMLRAFRGTVVLHCFSEPELLPPALEHGWYLSFAGNLTYPSAGVLRAAAAAVPSELLLVETDSPYLSPQPVRGRRNEPAHLLHTAHALAAIRGVEAAVLAVQLDENAMRAFGLP